jgi:HSP20 family molecular chaperone IbpA
MVNPMSRQVVPEGDGPEGTRTKPVFSPPADIYETKDALYLVLEMPGVQPDSIDVVLDKRVLTIKGGSGISQPEEGYSLTHAEFRDGDYERSFTLAESIDAGQIEASVRDGILRLVLPKIKPAPAKTITVKAG